MARLIRKLRGRLERHTTPLIDVPPPPEIPPAPEIRIPDVPRFDANLPEYRGRAHLVVLKAELLKARERSRGEL